MNTIKYVVDRGFRRAGEVRSEEDAIADNLIWRGFAEETDEEPDASTGEAHAVAQYHPEGAEAEAQERGGTQPLPAELNAPGEVGSNAPSAAGSDTPSDATNDAPSDAASTASAAAPATRSRTAKTGPVTALVTGMGTTSEGETTPVTASETANSAEVEGDANKDVAEIKNVSEIKDEDKDKAAEGDQSGQTS